jgi:Flp pilus assembly protein TadG
VVARGQALAEFAIVAPVLMLMMLAVLAGGLYFLAAQSQASSTSTIAGWAAANPTADPDDLAAFARTVSACPLAVDYAPNLVRVTLTCPTIAGELVPALPRTVVTTATAYVPDPTP